MMSINAGAFVWWWVDVEFFIFRCLRCSFDSLAKSFSINRKVLRARERKVWIFSSVQRCKFQLMEKWWSRPVCELNACCGRTEERKFLRTKRKHKKRFITLSHLSNDANAEVCMLLHELNICFECFLWKSTKISISKMVNEPVEFTEHIFRPAVIIESAMFRLKLNSTCFLRVFIVYRSPALSREYSLSPRKPFLTFWWFAIDWTMNTLNALSRI